MSSEAYPPTERHVERIPLKAGEAETPPHR